MKIVITNHTGARNRGCEALVLSKILGFKSQLQESSFEILTHDPLYDSWRFKDYGLVKFSYLTRTPEHTSSKLVNSLIYGVARQLEKLPFLSKRFDVTAQNSLRNADIIIPSGGDIFTSDYHNLKKHLSILLSSHSNAKIYLCGHTIGPFKPKDEVYFKKVIKRASLISVRESESYEYLKSLNLDVPVYLTADVAFTLPTMDTDAAESYLVSRYGISSKENSFVALSISQGIIKYSNLDVSSYYKQFADFINYLNDKGKACLLIPHVMEVNPNNNDVIACEEVFGLIKDPSQNRIIFGEPSAVQFKGIIGLCECLVGTRTHSTIASLSQLVPTVSVAYSRKAYGIMYDVFGEELGNKLIVPVTEMSLDKLINSYEFSIKSPPKSRRIDEIKKLSEKNFELIKEL